MKQNTPRLLTEAEARKLRNLTRDEYVAELRERGLIAEPVDPDLEEAREVCAQNAESDGFTSLADAYRKGDADHRATIQVALAALRRGRELAKPLTWEEVRDAYLASKGSGTEAGMITRLHAALVEQMK